MTDPIYLDYNATTPVDSAVMEAMQLYLRDHFGNPSSDHVYGYRTRAAVQTAREQLAALADRCHALVLYAIRKRSVRIA
jgi:cysteine desulfurase